MPVSVSEDTSNSWGADEDTTLPPSTEVFENGLKIVTDYKIDEDDKKVKVVRTYKIEKRFVSKSIAVRKHIPKYGDSSKDKPGPNPATTLVSEDIFMQFITSREESTRPEESDLDVLKTTANNTTLKCRTCQGEHWTISCPYKYLASAKPDMAANPMPNSAKPPLGASSGTATKYIAPSLRDGVRRDAPGSGPMHRDDTAAIRISNLSDTTVEADLEELVKAFGPVHKLFLAKEKNTGVCKGFAYIHFKFKADAAKAIHALNGHGYDHLILGADWSKPPSSRN